MQIQLQIQKEIKLEQLMHSENGYKHKLKQLRTRYKNNNIACTVQYGDEKRHFFFLISEYPKIGGGIKRKILREQIQREKLHFFP